jgi:hypothetical protein
MLVNNGVRLNVALIDALFRHTFASIRVYRYSAGRSMLFPDNYHALNVSNDGFVEMISRGELGFYITGFGAHALVP